MICFRYVLDKGSIKHWDWNLHFFWVDKLRINHALSFYFILFFCRFQSHRQGEMPGRSVFFFTTFLWLRSVRRRKAPTQWDGHPFFKRLAQEERTLGPGPEWAMGLTQSKMKSYLFFWVWLLKWSLFIVIWLYQGKKWYSYILAWYVNSIVCRMVWQVDSHCRWTKQPQPTTNPK